MSDTETKISIERQPAPDSWADAYREVMETVYQLTDPDAPVLPGEAEAVAEAVRSLVAFAAEIREGLTAGLITPTAVNPQHNHAVWPGSRCVLCNADGVKYAGIHPTSGYGTGPIVEPDSGRHGPQA